MRKLDADRLLAALGGIVKTQPLANLASLHSNRRIVARLVLGGPAENVDADGAFLQTLRLPFERPLHHIAQKIVRPLAGAKTGTVQNAIQRGTNRGGIAVNWPRFRACNFITRL